MRTSLFILLFLLQQTMEAQTAGFIGRRFNVQVDVGGMLASGPTVGNKGLNESGLYYGTRSLGLNTRAGFHAGYTLSRTSLLLAEFSYLKTGMTMTAYTPVINRQATSYERDQHDLFYHLQCRSVGLAYRFFYLKAGGIAPIGNFIGVHVDRHFITGEIVDKKTEYFFPASPQVHAKLGIEPNTAFTAIGMSFGNNMILTDRAFFSFEFRFNVPLRLIGDFSTVWIDIFSDNIGDNTGTTKRTEFDNKAYGRVALNNAIYFKFGLGYLLF